MKQIAFRAALLIGVLWLAGCGSVTRPVSSATVQPVVRLNESESAELVVLNISGPTLVASNQNITDHGAPLISLARQTYGRVRITAGPHEYRFDHSPSGKRMAALRAEVGKTYFLVVGYSPSRSWAMGLFGDPMTIEIVSEQEARPLMAGMTGR
jgi:hypothetical protein